MQDYYELLQVHPRADQDTIQAAYERLCERYADERLEGAAEELVELAQQKRADIDHAYAVLSDPERRAAYDKEVERPRKQSAAASSASPRGKKPKQSEQEEADEDEDEILIDYRPLPPAHRQERPRDFDAQPMISSHELARQRGRKASNSMLVWGAPVGVAAAATFLTVFVTLLIAGIGAPQPMPPQNDTMAQSRPPMQGMSSETQAAHQFEEQISAARQVTRQVPDNPNAWINLGNVLFDSVQIVQENLPDSETYRSVVPRWLEAGEAYQQALELEPNNATVRSDMGVCYCNYGSATDDMSYVDRGLQEVQKGFEVDPENGRVLLNLGTCLVSTQPPQTEEAMKHWRKVLVLPDVQEQLVASAQRMIRQYSN
jgi:curved DNA-binding protein CbpA